MKLNRNIILLGAVALLLSACGKKQQETKVERRDITEFVFATGILEPESQYNLTAQNDGYLIALGIEEGDIVQAGQVLAVIDNPQNRISSGSAQQLLTIARENAATDAPALRQVEANIVAAQDKVKQDEKQVERYRKLRKTTVFQNWNLKTRSLRSAQAAPIWRRSRSNSPTSSGRPISRSSCSARKAM